VARSIVVAITIFTLASGSSGCTWVALAPDAEGVRVGTSKAINGCTRVGTTKTRTKLKVGFFARGEKKVAKELATLARNDAPELGGNTVVADGPVDADGMQRFSIYDCPADSDRTP
jgi:hypothetical protein